jgi:glycosyltransferase involved in cell wall biosynthesis
MAGSDNTYQDSAGGTGQERSQVVKVAIVCDWLTGIGGAERVVLELHKLYPAAPIYTSQYDPSKIDWFKDADVRTGWLQRLPSFLKKFMPVLRAIYFSRLDLSRYDLVISETGAEAKGVRIGPKTTHICICNTPTHYYWSRYEEYMKTPGFGRLDPLARLGLRLLIGPMRRWDLKAAQRPTHMVAISSHIQSMIKQYYGRDSVVIHPPVDIERFAGQAEEPRRGFVTAGRQTPYKRIDLAVAACTELNLPLVVIGSGPDHKRLKKMAGKSVTFLRGKSDEEVAHYFQTSQAFIFPGLDDFGITPVEAMAAGTPVIAYKAGGALDYVEPGVTGEFFDPQTADALSDALKKFSPEKYNNAVIRRQAAKFSAQNFIRNFSSYIKKLDKRSTS